VQGHAVFPARFVLVGTMNVSPERLNQAVGPFFLPRVSTDSSNYV
jgi:hypothetical protein